MWVILSAVVAMLVIIWLVAIYLMIVDPRTMLQKWQRGLWSIDETRDVPFVAGKHQRLRTFISLLHKRPDRSGTQRNKVMASIWPVILPALTPVITAFWVGVLGLGLIHLIEHVISLL